jgi:hypothetical protein
MTVASVHVCGYSDGLCQVSNGLPLALGDCAVVASRANGVMAILIAFLPEPAG